MGLTILRLGRMGYQQVDLLKSHSKYCIVSSSDFNSNALILQALTVQQRLVEKVFVLELSFTESLLR